MWVEMWGLEESAFPVSLLVARMLGSGTSELSAQEGASFYLSDSEQLVDVKVLEKTKTGLEVSILPHNIPAFLPTPHLSDHVANGRLLHHWLQTGDTLHRVLCLSQSERHVVSLTGIWGWGKAMALGWEVLD